MSVRVRVRVRMRVSMSVRVRVRMKLGRVSVDQVSHHQTVKPHASVPYGG